MPTRSLNTNLRTARAAKQDEFYTQYFDIQKEVEAYLEFDPNTFRDKVVYCNCDDPFESNFFKYFAAYFNTLGLKKLISTSYDGSPIAGGKLPFSEYEEGNGRRQKPKAVAVILDQVKDEDGDGAANVTDVELFLKRNKAARRALKGDANYPGGDFRSLECIELLKGVTPMSTDMLFEVPERVAQAMVESGKKGSSYRIVNGKILGRSTSAWFTNLDHGRRHRRLQCMTISENLKFSKSLRGKSSYDRYDNYDAIEVSNYKEIPSDYVGAMGVPVTFLDKYNPEQFEILGITDRDNNSGLKTKEYTLQDAPNPGDLNRRAAIRTAQGLKSTFARLLIRHRQNEAEEDKKS